jgi:hypothetical protein
MSLEARIALLERENKRFRRIGVVGAAGLVLAACLSMAQASGSMPQALEVSELRVVNADGVVRATLTCDAEDSALNLFDEWGNKRTELLATPLESILTYYDKAGEKQVVLTTGYNDHGLYFMDPEGKDRIALVGLAEDTGLYFPDDLGLYVKPGSEKPALQLIQDTRALSQRPRHEKRAARRGAGRPVRGRIGGDSLV